MQPKIGQRFKVISTLCGRTIGTTGIVVEREGSKDMFDVKFDGEAGACPGWYLRRMGEYFTPIKPIAMTLIVTREEPHMDAKAKKMDKHARIMEVIMDSTEEWATDEYAVDDKQTPLAKELSKHITEMSFANEDKKRFAKMFAALSKENVMVEEDEDIKLRVLTAIVCTKADKHNYETDMVLVNVGDGTCVDAKGNVGGYIKPSRKILRPATPEEIKTITAPQMKELLNVVNIVFEKPKD